MNDRNNDEPGAGQRGRGNRPAWIIGVVLVLLLAGIALRGTFEEVNEDGSSNSDRVPAADNG